MVAPRTADLDRVKEAIIAKATRILLMTGAPLGTFGDMTEFGQAVVRPDFQITELLYGLMYDSVPEDLTSLVSTDDVIRHGLDVDPDDYPSSKLSDVERALNASCSWVSHYLDGGVGIS